MAGLVVREDALLLLGDDPALLEARDDALHGGVEVLGGDLLRQPAARGDGSLVRDVREVGAGEPCGLAGDGLQVDVIGEGLSGRVDAEDLLATHEVGSGHEHLPVEAAGPEQRGIEVLKAVRGSHHDDAVVRREAVQLDEQLVQRLILLTVEPVSRSRRTDGVELVDEDDRGRVLPRLGEELPDAGRAEAGEHLHERGGALGEERRAGLVRHGLRQQRLPGSRRSVEEDALRHARAELLEALRVAEEVDDLLELDLDLGEAGDVVPRDARARPGGGALGVHPRRQLHDAPEEVHHQTHQDQREPDQEHPADVLEDRAHDLRIGSRGQKP